jgi:hypothetical protein
VPDTAGWAHYRFEMDTTRPDETWTYSTRTATAWDFRARTDAPDEQVQLPLLQLNYHVDSDLQGKLAPGSHQTIGLKAFHLEDVQGAGRIRGATLFVSFDDGDHWRPVTLTRNGNGAWTANVVIPKQGADFLSLRADAWDNAHNEVQQSVIRAVGIG